MFSKTNMHFAKPIRPIILTLLALVSLLSGCVFLRLLETKYQLLKFNEYFDVNDNEGLVIVFKKSAILDDDILWLLKKEPTAKEKLPDGEIWTYVYKKLYVSEEDKKAENGEFDISLVMKFTEGKLSELRFPKRFLKAVSISQLREMLRAMGDAKVNELNRKASSELVGEEINLPKMDHVYLTLGRPHSTLEREGGNKLQYKYKIDSATVDKINMRYDLELKFTIRENGRDITDSLTKIRGLKFKMKFTNRDNDKS